jgi:hypothetical protein
LIRDDQRHNTPERRRVSVAEHEQFQKHLAASLTDQRPDPIDDQLADPILDHAPAYRSNKSTSHLLNLLDEIERGDG